MELKNGRLLTGRLSACLVSLAVPLVASMPAAMADYNPGQPLQFHDYSGSSSSHGSSSNSSYQNQSSTQSQSVSPSQSFSSSEAPADRAKLQQTLQSFFPSQSTSSDSSSSQSQGQSQPAGQPVSPPPSTSVSPSSSPSFSPPPSQTVSPSSSSTLFPQSNDTSTPSSASPPQAPTNAPTDSEPSSPKKKSKKNGLLNHLVTGVGSVVEATIAPVPGGAPAVSPSGHGYGPGHGYAPGGGLIPEEPSHNGAGLTASGLGMPGSLPVPPGGFVNEHDGNGLGRLDWAYAAEQKGDYHDAASRYHAALIAGTGTITDEDMKNATKNHTSGYAEMKKRMSNKNSTYQGWPVLEICKHYLWCEVADARKRHSTDDGADSIPSLIELQLADLENPAWWYLIGAAYASEHHAAEQHNYIVAWYQLNCGLQCKNMTPEMKNKILTLMHHIAPATLLQLQDYDRVRYEHCFDVVNAVDHPTVINYWQNGVIKYKWDSRASIDAMSYWLAKEFVKNKYPQFIKKYNAYVHFCRFEYPNKAIAVPNSPENDESHVFFYRLWEEKAFGPLDFGTSVL